MDAHSQDQEQLRLLSILHRVFAGLLALSACLTIVHLVTGLELASSWGVFDAGPDVAWTGKFFVVVTALTTASAAALAVCFVLTARSIARRRNRTFCLVVAGVACVFFPFGTALGLFTLFVLTRASVRTLFEPRNAAASPAGV